MADAERIWLEPECCAEPGVGRTWCSVNEWACCPAGECDAPKPTEYVRADLVEAREAAAALAMREACADYVADCLAELGLPLGVASIRALPLPAPDALARALEQARNDGMKEAARLVAASGLAGNAYAAVILSAMEGEPAKAYDARDNAPHDASCHAAIRARGKENTHEPR